MLEFLKGPFLDGFLVPTCCFVFLLITCESLLIPPSDRKNCDLNASAPFSEVVMIFDSTQTIQKQSGPACFGSLITKEAVLTTAWYFVQALDQFPIELTIQRYSIVAQYVWDYKSATGRLNPCYQLNTAGRVIFHPKSKDSGERLYFDFSILVLKAPYRMSKNAPNPPLSYFPTTPLELLLQIRYVNIYSYSAPCTWPLPLHIDKTYLNWVYNNATNVYSIPYRKRCVQLICEQKFPGRPEEDCRKKFFARLNATSLCMIPGWFDYFLEPPKVEYIPSPYAGVPLICNGSLLGQAVQVKNRHGYQTYSKDFVFVSTLLRIYPWLIQSISELLPTHPPPVPGVQDDTPWQEFSRPFRYYKTAHIFTTVHWKNNMVCLRADWYIKATEPAREFVTNIIFCWVFIISCVAHSSPVTLHPKTNQVLRHAYLECSTENLAMIWSYYRKPTPNWGRNDFQTLSEDDPFPEPQLQTRGRAHPTCQSCLLKILSALVFSLSYPIFYSLCL